MAISKNLPVSATPDMVEAGRAALRRELGDHYTRVWQSMPTERLIAIMWAEMAGAGPRIQSIGGTGLTPTAHKVLQWLRDYWADDPERLAPTQAEIANGIGIRETQVHTAIVRLRDSGYVDYAPRRGRSLCLIAGPVTNATE